MRHKETSRRALEGKIARRRGRVKKKNEMYKTSGQNCVDEQTYLKMKRVISACFTNSYSVKYLKMILSAPIGGHLHNKELLTLLSSITFL